MKRFNRLIFLVLALLFLVSCDKTPNHSAICDFNTNDIGETLYVGMRRSELFTAMGYPPEYNPLIDVDVSYVIEKNSHYRWILTDGNILDIMMEINDDSFCGTSIDAFHVSEIKISSPSGNEVYKQLCRPLDISALPQNFSLSDAKDCGIAVHENGHVTAGQETFAYFLEQTEKGKPCTIYIGNYYTLLAPSHYDPDYYESIKDDYPVLYISELTFDGKHYIHTQYDNGKKIVQTYAYLVPSYKPADAKKPNDSERSTLVYMLSDDPNGSFNDWMRAITSSSIVSNFKRTFPIYSE
ncbi:MAG: hypothetical protein IJ489_01710 [Clostridia bacterium]|nr:hypothetical protein [Clostridia bacterium]